VIPNLLLCDAAQPPACWGSHVLCAGRACRGGPALFSPAKLTLWLVQPRCFRSALLPELLRWIFPVLPDLRRCSPPWLGCYPERSGLTPGDQPPNAPGFCRPAVVSPPAGSGLPCSLTQPAPILDSSGRRACPDRASWTRRQQPRQATQASGSSGLRSRRHPEASPFRTCWDRPAARHPCVFAGSVSPQGAVAHRATGPCSGAA